MNINTGLIISFLLICTSLCFGQDKIDELNKFEWNFIRNPNSPILNHQFKITLSDSWFSRDKIHHFLTSAFLSGVGYYFLHDEQNFSNPKSQQVGICFSVSLGLLKEIRDGFMPKNAFSVKDFIADILGTIVGIALVSDF